MNQLSKIKNDIMYNTLGTLIYFFCQWLTTVLVVKISGYDDAGVLSLVISMTNIFFCIAAYGIRNYQVSDIKYKYTDSDYFITRLLMILISFVLFIISLYLLDYDDYVVLCSLVYIFFKFGEALTDVIFGSFQRYSDYKSIFISYTLKGTLTLILFILVLSISNSLFITLLSNVIVYYIIIIFYDFVILKKSRFRISFASYNGISLLKICFPLMLYSGIVPYLNFITRYVIELNYGTLKLGFYSSVTMVLVVMSTLMSSVFVSIIPKISYNFYNKKIKEIYILIKQVFIILGIFFILALLASYFLGDLVFSIIFNSNILSYMYLLIPTVICSFVLTLVTFFSSILIAINRNNQVLYGNFISVILCTITIYPFVNFFGMLGAILSLIFSLSISMILLIYYTIKNLK